MYRGSAAVLSTVPNLFVGEAKTKDAKQRRDARDANRFIFDRLKIRRADRGLSEILASRAEALYSLSLTLKCIQRKEKIAQ